jgi:hypothetical protein
VVFTVHDRLGAQLAVLLDDWLKAGMYTVLFEARGLPSGVYVYRLAGEGFSAERRMLLLK